MIRLYEKSGIAVNESLISQYLQDKAIAKSFAVYYDLFNKYRSDYQVDRILSGAADKTIDQRAINAKFDERLSLIGLILDAVNGMLSDVVTNEAFLSDYMVLLRSFKMESTRLGFDARSTLDNMIKKQQEALERGKSAGTVSENDARKISKIV